MRPSFIHDSSFRDPSGFLFYQNGDLLRQVNLTYRENYRCLMDSGLYKRLVDSGLMISHKEERSIKPKTKGVYKILRPERVAFISYPYEWCFSQLKDAALTTLRIQRVAMDYGMSLKDASAYNIQFVKGKPLLIDILSFERYQENKPWVAYRQFCMHFLAPLALMSYVDVCLGRLLGIYVNGIPLYLASKLLPFRTRTRFSLFSHIHLNAKSEQYFGKRAIDPRTLRLSKVQFLMLLDNLEAAIKGLSWNPKGTPWANYYEETNYNPKAFAHKKKIVAEFLGKIRPKTVWDIGANDGVFSRIASDKGIFTLSTDSDPAAVEKNYLKVKEQGEVNILPLLVDLTNPSPSIGWENTERIAFLERKPVDMVLALALIHHLAIGNNLPLERIARFFGRICSSLIVEFVPKSDSQVQRMLSSRQDIFPNYTEESFEKEFQKYFAIKDNTLLKDSERVMYLMVRK